MSSAAIHVEGLGKRYRLGSRQRYQALRDILTEAMTRPFRARQARSEGRGNSPDNTFWALRDVSFEIEPGEVVGIIGRNGAGKSTLLKILARITEPTEGCAEIRGRVGSLLEVGTGFHPELTGRENIYLNGAILGMTRREIQRKFDEITAFAEVEKFIDTPVKHFSSGMYMRLAFAVAAHLEPEILLVDEVLAVGDAQFQEKCLGKMSAVARGGRTVLFVSHNLGAISRLCARTFWIDAGQIRLQGNTDEIVSQYLTSTTVLDGRLSWQEGVASPGETAFRLDAVSIQNQHGEVTSKLDVRRPFSVEIRYRLLQRLPYGRVGFLISTAQGITVFEVYDADDERYAGPREPGQYVVRCAIPGNLLNANRYVLSVNAGVPNVRNLVYLEGILAFDVEDVGAVGSQMLNKRDGVVRPRLSWEQQALPA